jgi:NADH-quinone oxidoreductase subunit J
METIIFWLIAVMTAGSALFVVTSRNILHAGFALCMTFLGVAGLYVFLQADFVAAVQLIVYVGGILVLIMFAIMFSSNVVEDTAERGRSKLAMMAGGVSAAGLGCALMLLIERFAYPLSAANQHGGATFTPTVSALGYQLMGPYLLPFEVVSVLLLAALVGAVVIVRKELNN